MQEVASNACIIWLLATVSMMASPYVIQTEYKTDTNATQPANIKDVEVTDVLEGRARVDAFILVVGGVVGGVVAAL